MKVETRLCSPGGSTALTGGLRALVASCYYSKQHVVSCV